MFKVTVASESVIVLGRVFAASIILGSNTLAGDFERDTFEWCEFAEFRPRLALPLLTLTGE